jgi:hypothetical protein
MTRLDEAPRRWSRARLLAPVAAVAAIIVLAVVMREDSVDVASRAEVEREATDVRLKPEATYPEAGSRTAATPSPASATVQSRPRVLSVDLPVASLPATDLTIEALDVAGLDVMPVEAVALKELPPLAIDAMVIAPLDTSSVTQ